MVVGQIEAKENVDKDERGESQSDDRNQVQQELKAGCEAASASVNLDVNNVRARILNGGDMWWDLVGNARYEVPKSQEPPRKHSLFAGSLWIGGFDQGGNLRAAAMTYRQSGSDFYPGPLDTTDASVNSEVCNNWDKIWKVNRKDIEKIKDGNTNNIPDDIKNWPWRGDVTKGQSRYLAPFKDENNNGSYDPQQGDYPDVPGDQALWFVYNDKGNIHSETQASAIGLEVQTTAFAFQANDERNNMTFYKQKIINRSTNRLDSVHFGQWVDPDLGFAFDDFVGCDTTRDLGFCYNGDNFDDGVGGYGENPPAVGVDFFQGPTTRDGTVLGMDYFVYYNNDFSVTGNPSDAQHYYNYLTGTWKDGVSITCGGNGRGGSKECDYMFPGNPDGDGWSEQAIGNTPGDRRFIQSSGPFTLMPGAVNFVTVGVVWANATSGGNIGSLDLLRIADDKAQALYNNGFEPVRGPEPPDLKAQELEEKIILTIENSRETEEYFGESVAAQSSDTIEYIFQGYKLYQLRTEDVSSEQFNNPDEARVIRQVDTKDEITSLFNNEFNPDAEERQKTLKVEGSNNGIRHSFEITSDQFASGRDELVNNKAYHFALVPYASYNFRDSISRKAGTEYIEASSPAKVTVYPHKTEPELNGAITKAQYGDQPKITRVEGKGNGGLELSLTQQSINRILENDSLDNPTYKINGGPLDIFVNDPLNVPSGNFNFQMIDAANEGTEDEVVSQNAQWKITKLNGGDVVGESNEGISDGNEQVVSELGMSVKPKQVSGPKLDTPRPNIGELGFQSASVEFEDESVTWLSGVKDAEGGDRIVPTNWIRSGKNNPQDPSNYSEDVHDATIEGGLYEPVDPNEVYEDLLANIGQELPDDDPASRFVGSGGIIAPYGLVAKADQDGRIPTFGPALKNRGYELGGINSLNSVDLVFTSDKDKWTECVVLEMNPTPKKNRPDYDATKFKILGDGPYYRDHASWKDPNAVKDDGTPQYAEDGEKGKSWFPGYAINIETGERLNIMFGEDSKLRNENGADMIWNPTSNIFNSASNGFDRYKFGGKHYIYIMNSSSTRDDAEDIATAYDKGETYHDVLQDGNSQEMLDLFGSAMWVMVPTLAKDFEYNSLEEGLIPTETKIELRVDVPYQTYDADEGNNLPEYTFNTEGLATQTSEAMGKSALDMVRVVPNPYYAYNEYENSQIDSRVRITNLPQRCEISIYTLDGKLIRKFSRDQDASNHKTFLDWDLNNSAGVPIGSGVYLVHVNGFELGQKTIKWFGMRRPLDLDTF